jgi:CRISPR-associated protein Csd2
MAFRKSSSWSIKTKKEITKMEPMNKRYDFILLFDVKNGNPNGDPDAGNSPRIDPETGRGLVSDVCLKRKIRNYICLAKSENGKPKEGYDIYVKEKAILNLQHQRAYDSPALKKLGEDEKKVDKAKEWMCQTFFDIRMFGAVMTTKVNCGQVRGPVQIAFSQSVDPITPLEQSITRMAVTTEEEAKEQAKKQEGGNRTMGRKEIVPYALYIAHGFVSPYLAKQTGFSNEDLELLWKSLEMMFEHDRSAARGEMAARKLIIFEHESPLGNASAHSLFERLKITRKDTTKPAREYVDYEVALDKNKLPLGIKIEDKF